MNPGYVEPVVVSAQHPSFKENHFAQLLKVILQVDLRQLQTMQLLYTRIINQRTITDCLG